MSSSSEDAVGSLQISSEGSGADLMYDPNSPTSISAMENLSTKGLTDGGADAGKLDQEVESELDVRLAKLSITPIGQTFAKAVSSMPIDRPNFRERELNRKALDEGWGFSNVVSISEYLGESTVANPELLDPANQRRVILQAVKVNYVVHGVIKAKKSYGLHVEVDSVCDRHDQVFELLRTNPLRGSIHVSDLSDRYLQNPDDHLDDYRVGDRVKAAVREIDILDEKLALTFRKSTVNIPLSMRHHRLGLNDYYAEERQRAAHRLSAPPTPSFNEDMKNDPLFLNPNAVKYMLDAYGLNDYGTFLSRRIVAVDTYFDLLRSRQNQEWAQDTVELGITHAKKSDYKSAMKFYNQALQVDPKNKDAYVARGAAFANVNMLEDAVLDFEKALTIDGTDANANKYLAIIREKLRQQRETREAAQYIPSTPQPMSKHSSIAPHDGQGITTAQKLKMLIEADKRSSSTPSSSQHRKSTKDRERDKDSDKYKDKDKDKDKRQRRDKRQSKRSSKKKHKKRHRDDTRGRSSASPSKSSRSSSSSSPSHRSSSSTSHHNKRRKSRSRSPRSREAVYTRETQPETSKAPGVPISVVK